MLELVVLVRLLLVLKHREMDERIEIFVECLRQGGKIDLTSHLEIEEVAVDIDAALHQVVVDDVCIEIVHPIGPTAIAI